MASSTKPESCPHCGQLVEEGEGPHRTFTRVVRPRMRFGAYAAGQSVEICERDIERRATIMGTMSVEDWENVLKLRAQPREPVSDGTSSRELAASTFERLKEEAQANKADKAADKGHPAGRKRV
jgi:hypothetical protein